jgi:hypothetical protein
MGRSALLHEDSQARCVAGKYRYYRFMISTNCYACSKHFYLPDLSLISLTSRCVSGEHGDSTSDWKNAEKRYIRETFKRRIGVDAHVTSSIAAIADMKVEAANAEVEAARLEIEAARSEIEAAKSEAEEATIIVQELKDAKDRAEMQLWKAKQEVSIIRSDVLYAALKSTLTLLLMARLPCSNHKLKTT